MNAIYNFLWILLALLLQVLIFNHLSLWGGVALVYVLALIKMPVEISRSLQILMGFLAGLAVDLFCNTPGLHALAATTTMWLRTPVLHLFVNADDVKSGVPGFYQLGLSAYMRYAVALIILHCLVLYFVESFSLFNLGVLLLKIVISVALTAAVAVTLEFASMRR